MSSHKSIPERPHGGTRPSWASTSSAAPPARSDPSGARVTPFARAPESRPAFTNAAGWRRHADNWRSAARCPVSGSNAGQLPDCFAKAGAVSPARDTRSAPGSTSPGPGGEPRGAGGAAAWQDPPIARAVPQRCTLSDRVAQQRSEYRPFRRLQWCPRRAERRDRRAGGSYQPGPLITADSA